MATGSEPGLSVSVVIPTLGTRREILDTTIQRLSTEPCVAQIIVVGDPTNVSVSPAGHQRNVTVVASPGTGPNASRQVGLDAASEEIVLFLDDDVLPDPGLATGHAGHHANGPDLVVVGYMPVVRDTSGRYATATSELYGHEYERRVTSYEEDRRSILRNLWGGNISLRRRDALRVGVNNEAHPGRRHEDQDFGLRCAAAGLSALFDRELRAAHHYRRSRGAFLRDAWAQGYERALLRQNNHESEWFVRGAGRSPHELGSRASGGFLRTADLMSLKAARRLQLWRGFQRAHRETHRQEGHP